MNKQSIYHQFNVTHKTDLTLAEAFKVATEIVDDVSTTLKSEWPRNTELRLRDTSRDERGVRVYHFDVVVL